MSSFVREQAIKLYDRMTGRRFWERLNELNRSQWFSRDELLELQHTKLHRLLQNVYQNVPYYRRLFDQVGFKPDDVLTDLASMRKIPVLTKQIIREHFDELLTTDSERRKTMSRLTTGGSTGHPLVFMQDSDFRDYVTADLHRHLGWAGWELGQYHVYIWGTNFEAISAKTRRAKAMDWALNRFVTNAYVLSEESLGVFAEQVRKRRPRILFGYPSSVFRFAEFVREHRYDDIKFEAIFSSAEVLYPAQREYIDQTFGSKMFNRYATRELACIGCECPAHTGLHVSLENVYIEILQDGRPVGHDQEGDIIVTNLNNYGMPFIRYSVGDIGAWYKEDDCSCGRQSPMIDLVQGRQIDMFRARDGRKVWGGFASPLFGLDGVRQFQLVQKSLDLVVARIVKDAELDQSRLDEIERTVKVALGDHVVVEFEFPDEIPVYKSGKYRYAICEMDES